jgi:hypothetical protein
LRFRHLGHDGFINRCSDVTISASHWSSP